MKLYIEGYEVNVMPDESLLDIVKRLGLMNGKLSNDPIAAKIAGEVFTLNYVPVRSKDMGQIGETKRKAIEASGGKIKLLRYTDPAGYDVYFRTAQFVIFLALRQLWPDAKARMHCTVGDGLYIEITNAEAFDADILEARVKEIVDMDIPLRRRRISTVDAIKHYAEEGQNDKVRLFSYRPVPTLDVYEHEDFSDYYYGEMAPSTGFLKVWDIIPATDGFVFIFPGRKSADEVAEYREMPNSFNVYIEGKKWGELMECETVADLNEFVDSGKIRELIRVNEALHEKRFSTIADMICSRGCKAVMLAGPSSSGKTTSANRLATQLRVHGRKPILMSLDDYYIDRDKIPEGPNGEVDLEHINTIDTKLFGEHLSALLRGEEVEIPSFNFKTGKREYNRHFMKLGETSVIIVEGLHALNPAMLPDGLPQEAVFKLFVCPFLPLNLDDHNRIASSYLRLLRRIVRDYETRGSSVSNTLSMWQSVRRGEEKWIFPFQEKADVIFNSSTLYELAVLCKHIFPLLLAIGPEDEYYDEVRAIVKVLNFVHPADVDDEIPPTSLVREFIGGNAFYRKEAKTVKNDEKG